MNVDDETEVGFLEAPKCPEQYERVGRIAAPAMQFNGFPSLKDDRDHTPGQIFGKYEL